MDDEIIPHVEAWESAGEVPLHVFQRASEAGVLMACCGWPEDIAGLPPRPDGFDGFWTLICFDEISRCASGGVVWGLLGGFGIGLPPVVFYGSPELKELVALPCLLGKKRIALAVSEPTGGSDVANLKTTAVEVCISRRYRHGRCFDVIGTSCDTPCSRMQSRATMYAAQRTSH